MRTAVESERWRPSPWPSSRARRRACHPTATPSPTSPAGPRRSPATTPTSYESPAPGSWRPRAASSSESTSRPQRRPTTTDSWTEPFKARSPRRRSEATSYAIPGYRSPHPPTRRSGSQPTTDALIDVHAVAQAFYVRRGGDAGRVRTAVPTGHRRHQHQRRAGEELRSDSREPSHTDRPRPGLSHSAGPRRPSPPTRDLIAAHVVMWATER